MRASMWYAFLQRPKVYCLIGPFAYWPAMCRDDVRSTVPLNCPFIIYDVWAYKSIGWQLPSDVCIACTPLGCTCERSWRQFWYLHSRQFLFQCNVYICVVFIYVSTIKTSTRAETLKRMLHTFAQTIKDVLISSYSKWCTRHKVDKGFIMNEYSLPFSILHTINPYRELLLISIVNTFLLVKMDVFI